MTKKLKVGILLFNEIEVLDFAGPFEVFSLASILGGQLCEVETISENGELIKARNGLKVLPDKSFKNNPQYDILIIPGGYGAELEVSNSTVINWIKQQQNNVDILASICTGAFLLAEAGILDNKKATSHWMDLDRLERDYPKVDVRRGVKFTDEDPIFTSGGISAGINLSFYLLQKLFGSDVAKETAKKMEYDIDIKN